ncbi:MAG: RDD family protein [Actinomycetota bacterium]|nr:RDD family protein [Actinomycetota bacterium]
MSSTPPPPPPGYVPYQSAQMAPQYAGFGSRLGAYILDALIAGLFSIPAVAVLLAGPSHIDTCTINDELQLCDVPDNSTIAIAVALGVAALAVYLTLYCRMVGKGQSWGHRAVSIRVADATTGQPIGTGRAVGRYFGRVLSAIPCYLGFLWSLWDERKQTWHDKLTNSVVLKS